MARLIPTPAGRSCRRAADRRRRRPGRRRRRRRGDRSHRRRPLPSSRAGRTASPSAPRSAPLTWACSSAAAAPRIWRHGSSAPAAPPGAGAAPAALCSASPRRAAPAPRPRSFESARPDSATRLRSRTERGSPRARSGAPPGRRRRWTPGRRWPRPGCCAIRPSLRVAGPAAGPRLRPPPHCHGGAGPDGRDQRGVLRALP